ncbi:MAG TPA: aromatic amino acid lyase, partial [Candidatus Udaeobacter sp.]|nr:aromatic amino acid lyase [Candidatus Udaeobacter sp.]
MPSKAKSGAAQAVQISGAQLTTSQVAAVARDKLNVQLSQEPAIRKKIVASRSLLEEKLRRGEIIYGVNTGLGGNVRFILPPQDLAAHQENIFHFLICGTGNPLPDDAVRAAILLRANALAKGYSAVRMVVIERLIDLLNHDIMPIVPAYGSVGASGDLIPSAYIGRVLLGHGEVVFRDHTMAATTALEQAHLQPLSLEP